MTLFEAVVFFIPAGIGNMAPIIAAKIPALKDFTTPVDFGKTWRGKRILGDHKTWRGFASGTIAGALAAVCLYKTGLYDLNILITAAIGGMLGFGALVGDSIKSFFKRQIGIASGKTWFPFDQLDYIVGGILFVVPFHIFTWQQVLTIFISYFLLHMASTNIGYHLKLKKDPI